MYEIVLKAHVNNKQETAKKLSTFATYKKHVEKHDVYWLLQNTHSKIEKNILVRIREEISNTNNKEKKEYLITYKHKSLQFDKENKAYEVNNEYEFRIDDKTPFEVILKDSGYHVKVKKNKSTDIWQVENASLELSTIDLLGDFLEIEILSKTNDEKTVKLYRNQLFKLLQKSGLSRDAIENRYYSEMIENLEKENK